MKSIWWSLFWGIFGLPVSAQHSTVPVVLLDGYEWSCLSPPTLASYFGNLGSFLSEDGAPVSFFGNCAYGSAGIDQIAAEFGPFLAGLGPGPVDVIAHSMGGLIVRSYLAGLNLTNNTVDPPLDTHIRKLVLIGTPNFGTDFNWPLGLSTQVNQMQYGSLLTWGLATWNQDADDLRGIDTIAIVGNAHIDPDGVVSDGVVAVASASLDFAYHNRTLVIPYCHTNTLDNILCTGPPIANVDSRAHLTYQIIRSFLDGNTVWESMGISPAQATNNRGGMIWGLFDANDQPLAAMSPLLISGGQSAQLSAGTAAWYMENAPADTEGSLTFGIPSQSQPYTVYGSLISPGGFQAVLSKFFPKISARGIVSSAGTPPGAQSVAADSLISIYGLGLASSTSSSPYPWPSQLAGTTVTIDGFACLLNYAGPTQVNALVPASLVPGLHSLTLQNPNGQHTVTLMIEPTVPTLFSSAGYAAALHPNYQPVSTSKPAAVGETISLFATGLGAVTLTNGLETANTTPSVFINGASSRVTFAGRAPGYQGLDQINVQVPVGIPHGTTVPVVITSGNRTSNQVLLAVN